MLKKFGIILLFVLLCLLAFLLFANFETTQVVVSHQQYEIKEIMYWSKARGHYLSKFLSKNDDPIFDIHIQNDRPTVILPEFKNPHLTTIQFKELKDESFIVSLMLPGGDSILQGVPPFRNPMGEERVINDADSYASFLKVKKANGPAIDFKKETVLIKKVKSIRNGLYVRLVLQDDQKKLISYYIVPINIYKGAIREFYEFNWNVIAIPKVSDDYKVRFIVLNSDN